MRSRNLKSTRLVESKRVRVPHDMQAASTHFPAELTAAFDQRATDSGLP
jgi:hypothetical protein